MKCEEAVIQAMARASHIGNNYPTTRSVLYRRLGVRQQQLYTRAAQVNADYCTVCADGVLDAGGIDLNLLLDPNEELETLRRLEVLDPGASGYAAGDKISMVPFDDADAAIAPRAYVIDRAVQQVGTDLAAVTSIMAYYTKKPMALTALDRDTDLVLPTPFDELLPIDLTRFMVRLDLDVAKEPRDVFLAALEAEEKELLASWDQHVAGFVQGVVSRFGPPGRTPTA